MNTVGLADIQNAAQILQDVIAPTPIEHSRALSEMWGAPVHLKCENLQHTGSFKLRGAYVRLARLSAEERARGVVAASAGNHAQGVALAGARLGVAVTVFMPRSAALPKIDATESYGARVELVGADVAETLAHAERYAAETGAVLVHPFDHPDVITGQGTIGLEILEQVPDVQTVLVPTGGGGLLAGVAAALAEAAPHVRVIGVQAERAAAYPPSLRAQEPQTVAPRGTMADGIAVPTPGTAPFEIVRDLGVEVITVGEDVISRALLALAERAKLIVEPAGAVGVAAIVAQELQLPGPVVPILSGGNIDPVVLLRVLRHGLSAAGRFIHLRIHVTDNPGVLASLLNLLADLAANVMHVEHTRAGLDLSVDEVEISMQLETRGTEHCREVLDALRTAGYRVVEREGYPA